MLILLITGAAQLQDSDNQTPSLRVTLR